MDWPDYKKLEKTYLGPTKYCRDLQAQLTAARAERDRYRDALRGLPLVLKPIDEWEFCPICDEHILDIDDHAPDCAKAAAEKEGE